MNSMNLFGKALKSCFEGNRESSLIIRYANGESEVLIVDVFFRQANLLNIDEIALHLCKDKILDIGAGTGDHALFLQDQGFEITAMDISKESCEIMQKRGLRKVICSDIFSLNTTEKYDTILLLGRSIGAVGDCNGFLRFLELSKRLLSKKGIIIFNSINSPSKDEWQSRQMRFEYQQEIGDAVNWFDIGEDLLSQLAYQIGFNCEVKISEKDGNYLAMLGENETQQ